MKLYYSTGACSLSPHIVLCEGGFGYELERVDFATGKTEHGIDYKSINPNGYVPALLLDNGEILVEGPAIVQYLADQVPEKKLAPACGTLPRYRLMQWLNFISTEVHKSFSPFFNKDTPQAWKDIVMQRLTQRFDYLNNHLGNNTWLMGDDFSVVDAYLFTVLRWCRLVKIDITPWPLLTAYIERVAARPAVITALQEEGII
jgi:glutathione S-transferase